VRKYLPSGVNVAQRDGRVITLEHLATHTSGLPRLPANLLPQIAESPGNPYAKYTVEQLCEAIGSASLATTPGTHYAYSNFGFGLLGHVLALRANMSYEDLIVKKICEPLGMHETRITIAPGDRVRFAQGHTAAGKPASPWDLGTVAGGGGLRSTVGDMLRFLSAQLEPRRTPLTAALEMTHVPRHDIDGPRQQIALGWHRKTTSGVFWHNGETGGYHSFIALQKDSKIGVVILSNTASGAVDELGWKLIDLLLRQATAGKNG
jgi:CubicO group peptidase (beta-lactamase class C family)